MKQINEEALKRNKLTDEDLEQATGGTDEITVKFKTLEGEPDEYIVPPHINGIR